MVTRIAVDERTGLATGVHYVRDGRERFCKARMVAVAGYSIETPRLLLNSACARFPDGLANSSGLVGTHLMVNSSHTVYGRFEAPVYQYKAPPGLAITQDFYETDPRRDYARGYSIECVGPFPIQFAQVLSGGEGMWGRKLRTCMMDYNHYAGWALNGECLPYPSNTVTVVPEEKDQYGLPIARVTFAWGENEQKMIEAGIEQMNRILEAAGGQDLFEVEDTAHIMGTCRMGSDPSDSVVDRWCRSWDVRNLFICDGSVFASSSGVNPSLTIQAIAARTADYLIDAAARGDI
jgi:choline dehydrogenase-like flavoprotein